MKRFVLRSLGAVLALVVLALVAGQVILWTDLPRRMVESTLGARSGLEISISDLETGWGGRTTMRGFTVTVPLEDDPLLTIPQVDVTHAGLIRLLLTRSIDLEDLAIRKPILSLRENQRGEWNGLRAVESLGSAMRLQRDSSPLPSWPHVEIRNATVELAFRDGSTVTHSELDLTARPQGAMGGSFKLSRAPDIDISGSIVTRSPMHHTIAFDIDGADTLIDPWINIQGSVPLPQRLVGSWSGRVSGSGLAGRLTLGEAVAGDHRIRGEVRIEGDLDRVTLSPVGLEIESPLIGANPMLLESGRAAITHADVSVQQLVARARGVAGMLDGRWSLAERTGEFTLRWKSDGLSADLPLLSRHLGTLHGTLSVPLIGLIEVGANGSISGVTSQGVIESEVIASVRGPAWDSLAGRVRFPSLVWRDDIGAIHADGLAFSSTLRWPNVHVSDLSLPGPAGLSFDGTLDAVTGAWALNLAATQWLVPRTIDEPVSLDIQAAGDFTHAEFTRLHVTGERVDMRASGRYDSAKEQPLLATARLRVDRIAEAVVRTSDQQDAAAPATANNKPAGTLDSELNMQGAIHPLNLTYEGRITLTDLPIGERTIDELSLPWRGSIGATHATFRADAFELFGGEWQVTGDLEYEPRTLVVNVGGGAPLRELLSIVEMPLQMDGAIQTQTELRVPGLDADQVEIVGEWQVTDLQSDRFAAGRGRGRMRVVDQRLELHEIHLEQGEGRLDGSGEFNLSNRRQLKLDLTARQWPASLAGTDVHLRLDGTSRASLDVIDQTMSAELSGKARVFLADRRVGDVDVVASVAEQNVRIDELRAAVFGGEFRASGTAMIDDWTTVRLDGAWDRIDLTRLVEHVPAARDLRGVSAGTITISRAADPRALEPVRIQLQSRIADGMLRDRIGFSSIMLDAYAGGDRIILNEGVLHVAGGAVRLWGRSSMHGAQRYLNGHVQLQNLDLDQITHAVFPDRPPIPGRANGRVAFGGYAGDTERMFGQGEVSLSQSDVGSLPGFDLLYNLLHLDFNPANPTGYGVAELRLEGPMLEVSRMEYFNRGTNVTGSFTVRDVTKGEASPVEGVAIGAVLPFRDLDLPLFGDLERLVKALQSDAVAVKVSGTVGAFDTRQVLLTEVGSTLQRLLRTGN